jgi:hypothetical protein
VNFAGAATVLSIGAATGTITIGNPTVTMTNGTTFRMNGVNPSIGSTNTGTASIFNNAITTVNIGGAATTINLGNSTTNVNIGRLILTTDLEVQYGGTGRSTFTTNGVIYGNTTDGLLVTAASVPGSNATTSYGILTTNVSNVPVWTDTIDGGSY